ncbi:MAG: hypothetical protein GY842_17330, partial [bacterium]|nr:hypothetical protein [bacterium]
DYFKVNPINNNADPLIQDPELKLDEFRYCISGPVLMDWADCNGNCVDDLSDISNGLDTDCNANDIPDFCEADQNCSCGSAATSVACMACNHEHEWDFDTESPAFVTGDLDCQKGWTLEQTSAYPAAEIVSASGLPIPMSGRAVKLNPREGTAGDIPQGARGPRTRDEQPGMPGTGDAGMEYWEVDVVIDESPTSDGGDVMFVVWNMCDVFLNDDITNGVPVCFSNTAPTCYRVTGGESSTSVYARFNAGVRFRR